MRKTKIVCTLGPSSDSVEMIEKLISAGVNVFRLNTSHGDAEHHLLLINRIKEIRNKKDLAIGILLDLEGPKIRIGKFENGSVEIKEGDTFYLYGEESLGNKNGVSINYSNLSKEVHSGDMILLYDGLIGLKVQDTDGKTIKTIVQNGGMLSDRKGVNVPGVDIGLPALTEKDKKFIKMAIENNVDFIAQSFVRKPEDLDSCREEMKKYGKQIPIISKIETKQSLVYLNSIIYKSDGVMVARGDLGVEIPTEDVPVVQKNIIRICNSQSKPVITATQMLESMVENPRPTRAEASDIANAILDGTDAIMLSGETTIGKYPVEAVMVMDKISRKIEETFELSNSEELLIPSMNETESICRACWQISKELEIKVIVTSTITGITARRVSKYKPKALLIGTTPNQETFYRLSLVGGVLPVKVSETTGTDEMIDIAVKKILELNLAKKGENILITAGIPFGKAGNTNMLKIHQC